MALTKEARAERVAMLRDLATATDPAVLDTANGAALLAAFSPRNALLILAQRPSASVAMGFHAWRQAGRSVRKGEKGLAILAPMSVKGEDDGEGRTVFRVVYVFDVSQTEPLSADSPVLARELVSA